MADPNGNHLSVHTRGTLPNSSHEIDSKGSTTSIPELADGAVHRARIVYVPGLLKVFMDNNLQAALEVRVDLETIGLDKGRAWVGFTASTYTVWSDHAIISWSFQETQPRSLPEIIQPLYSDVLLEGSSANLGVQIKGGPAPNYQWFFNGQPISNATNTSYAIPIVSPEHAGIYWVVASNVVGSVTNEPAAIGVNNVRASNVLGLVLTSRPGTQLTIQTAPDVHGPWSEHESITVSNTPHTYIDFSANQTGRRYYRVARSETELPPAPASRLEAWRFPCWTFSAPAGTRHQIEYVNAEIGFTHWKFLTNLTLPESPYLFIDVTATNQWPRYYRSTLLP